ncbi:LEA type 2 family protein [Arenimonas sp.]|uniref:LEA type 2 family protein n=1 Tax=Arenimonas sp. TaxID=1872635 RepID=UPI0039E33422
MRLTRTLAFATLFLSMAALLAACGGRERKRINPPSASLQELVAQANGQWQLKLRLQNFSSVPITFDNIDGNLTIGGQSAGSFSSAPAISIGPETSDIVVLTMKPSLEAKTTVATALAVGQSLPYRIEGRIRSHDPNRDDQFKFESALSPAPGLPGVMR